MPPEQHFKLPCKALLLGIILSIFPLTGFAMIAGQVNFAVGDVAAAAPDGSRRPLAKGSVINVGETISTGANARAQVRFTDGGYISLQPDSLFRVDDYNFKNKPDGAEKGFFSLLKGGLRAITGAIGRVNRDTYRVTTPVATIGIRGTGYNAVLNEGLLVDVGEGAISLTNDAGFLMVPAGGAAFVATLHTPPARTAERPNAPPARWVERRLKRAKDRVWDRWNPALLRPGTMEALFLYLKGIPASPMPTTGGAIYNMAWNSAPAASNGTTGWHVKGFLAADFATPKVGVNLVVENPQISIGYQVTGFVPISGARFDSALAGASLTTASPSCPTACTTSIKGLFVGPNATHAGLDYLINDPGSNNNLQGQALFAR